MMVKFLIKNFWKFFFPYREKYTIKDLKLEKEKNKNYTIDDIQFKDENYEIPSLNEKLKNSLKKYSNINPLNNNNDNYLNYDININQPYRGMTNTFALSSLSNDDSMDKKFIIKKKDKNPIFSSTLNKSN